MKNKLEKWELEAMEEVIEPRSKPALKHAKRILKLIKIIKKKEKQNE